MQTHKLSENFTLHTPDDFEKVALPFFNEWVSAIESGNFKKGKSRLRDNDYYCCLGVLSAVQNRLSTYLNSSEETCYCDSEDGSAILLDSTNPAVRYFDVGGHFPSGCYVKSLLSYSNLDNIWQVNDDAETWTPVLEIIKLLWKQAE